jgi:hypothetical protein
VLPTQRPDGIFPEFRAFWNTDQIFLNRSDSPTYTGDLGLAEFSSFFFVTDDTMLTGGEPVLQDLFGFRVRSQIDFTPQHSFKWPRLADVNRWSAFFPRGVSVQIARAGEIPPGYFFAERASRTTRRRLSA